MKAVEIRVHNWKLLQSACVGLVIAVFLVLSACDDQTATSTHSATPSTSKVAPTSTPQPIHYPPTTQADLRGLAAEGDESAIHGFHSEGVGLVGVCPESKQEVTVDPSITGRQLAEDLLAYFFAQHLENPCGSLLLAYHTQAEADDAYTAGRIILDVNDSSGAGNIDPNATNLKYSLTLDIGSAISSSNQEFNITYQK